MNIPKYAFQLRVAFQGVQDQRGQQTVSFETLGAAAEANDKFKRKQNVCSTELSVIIDSWHAVERRGKP